MSKITKIGVVGLVLSFLAVYIHASNDKLTWTSLNVSTGMQGDAHLISKGNKHYLIDTGEVRVAREVLIPNLESKGINQIEAIIISHPHFDHYGGVFALVDNGIKIKTLYMNMPTKAQMDREWWGGKYDDLIRLRKRVTEAGTKIKTLKRGDSIVIDNNTKINILYYFDGIHTPVEKTDINDMSIICMLEHHNNKFLFTGDLNKKIGQWLADNAQDIKADIMKFPHHGTEGYAPDAFFDTVEARAYIVPGPEHLWESKRSKRARAYVEKNNTPCFVNGIDGNIVVESTKNGFTISSELTNKHANFKSVNENSILASLIAIYSSILK